MNIGIIEEKPTIKRVMPFIHRTLYPRPERRGFTVRWINRKEANLMNGLNMTIREILK
jgi:hypothetical protein